MRVIESHSVCVSVHRQQLAMPAVNDYEYFISSDRMQVGSQLMSLAVTPFSSVWKRSRRAVTGECGGAVTYRRRRIANQIPRFCRWRTRNKWRKYLLHSLTTKEYYVSFAWIENGNIQDVSFILCFPPHSTAVLSHNVLRPLPYPLDPASISKW